MPRHHQLALFTLDDRPAPKLRKHTPAHRKAVAQGEQIHLAIKERRFLPVVTVPATREDCPTERPCPHVRCEWHTATVLAEDRAGRPGLSHVPRDATGRTLPVTGDAGDELAETTLRPIWLGYGWSAKAEIERDSTGQITNVEFVDGVNGPHAGRWEAMQVVDGEVLEVWCGDERVAMCRVVDDETVAFDRVFDGVVVELRRSGVQPSCGLDVIEAAGGPSSTMVVARAMGRSPSWVRKLVRRVLSKLAEEGVTAEEMRTLLGGEK